MAVSSGANGTISEDTTHPRFGATDLTRRTSSCIYGNRIVRNRTITTRGDADEHRRTASPGRDRDLPAPGGDYTVRGPREHGRADAGGQPGSAASRRQLPELHRG